MSKLLWEILVSKINASSVTWLSYSPVCFLESQQHYWPNTSLWHVLLVPDRVTHDLFVFTHVPRSPCWHREPVLCSPGLATQTCATGPSWPPGQVWLPSPWWAPLTQGQQNTQQETTIIVTTWTVDNILSQMTELLLLKAPSPASACLRCLCWLAALQELWVNS